MGATITKMTISIILLSVVMVVFGMAYGNVQKNYSPSAPYNDTEFRSFNSSFNTITGQMEEIKGYTVSVTTKHPLDLSKYFDVLLVVVGVGKVFVTIPNVITDYVNLMQCKQNEACMLGFPIPSFIISALVTIVMILIIMKVAAIFLKREEV